MDNRKYCQIICDFVPYANSLFPEGWVLQQGGAAPHTSKYSQEIFESQSLENLLWPANSPDQIYRQLNVCGRFDEEQSKDETGFH